MSTAIDFDEYRDGIMRSVGTRAADVPALPASDEYAYQGALAERLLTPEGGWMREHLISPGCVVDFFHDGSGVVAEVKIRAARGPLLRQLARYAEIPRVSGVLLVTPSRRLAAHVPESFVGKPCAAVLCGALL